jgi:hypothetical protein
MADEVDEPGQDPATPRQGDLRRRGDTGAPSAPFKHTRWQKLIRSLFKLYGPAQTGLPPYATPQEREAWRQANRPQPKERKPAAPPPGYEITEYRDGQGYVHRSLVPITPPPLHAKQPETEQTDQSSPEPDAK